MRQARRALRLKGPAWLNTALALLLLLSVLPASSYAAGSLAPASSVRVLGVTAGVGMTQGEVEGAAVIAVTFSEPMNLRSAEAAFSIKPSVPGTFAWQKATLLFTPRQALSAGTTYTVTVGKSARATRGPALAGPFSYSFTTAPPPTVLRTLPSAGASDVPTDTVLTLSFDRLMSPLDSLSNTPDAARWVTISPAPRGRWFWLGTATVGFRPEGGFRPGTEYSVEVKPGWPAASGVPLQSGLSFRFSTLAPAVVGSSPADTALSQDLDVPIVARFNQPVDAESVQSAFSLAPEGGGTPVNGTYSWSPDSRVMTFTPASLLAFNTRYVATIAGPVKPLNAASDHLKATTRTWRFTTTIQTQVSYGDPKGTIGLERIRDLSITFNNPLKPGQDFASFLSITPQPEEIGALRADPENGRIYVNKLRLLPDTAYMVEVKPGLLDKWGFPVKSESWQVLTTPRAPGIDITGGSFQPIHPDGPSQVGMRVANLTKVRLSLYSLTEQEVFGNITSYRTFHNLLREWDLEVPASNDVSTVYPLLAVDAGSDRLAPGYYFLRATSVAPDGRVNAETGVVLMVGRTGLVAKSQGNDLLVWATDLLTGRPVPDYPLRVQEQVSVEGQATTLAQQGRTGPDGVLRLKLKEDSRGVIAWSDQPGDAAVVSTAWSYRVQSSDYNDENSRDYGDDESQAAIYTDRPIYRPGQVVYFSGIYRHNDDASYSLPPAGTTVDLFVTDERHTLVYSTTLSLSALGTFNGQFELPASAPTGEYRLAAYNRTSVYNELVDVSFQVEEYRKPDFEVNVTTREGVSAGQPVTATLSTSYYFGGPLAHLTATLNVWDGPYRFHWADPQTGERYRFGEERDGKSEDTRSERSYERSTDGQGLLVLDLGQDVDTSNGSRSLLVEGQVQDLSNQRVAKRDSLIVHQGLYYVGLREDTYIGQAGQPFAYTLRTVAPDDKAATGGRVVPGVPLTVRVLRQEWADSELHETEVATGSVTTDAEGRARYAFTPEAAGAFRLVVEGTDSLGNKIRSSTRSWVSGPDSGSVRWRYSNDRSVDLVADKEQYNVGETARLLVTSPFTEATALLTVERGHLRRYSVVTLSGGAPVVEVRLEEGDLPNVHIGITLLGRGPAPAFAPPGWVDSVQLREGSTNLHVSAESKRVRVSIEPQGQGGLKPGGTTNVLVRTTGYDGKPTPAELSLAVVDKPIFALADDNSADLFDMFWYERPSQVETSSSYRSGESHIVSRGDGVDILPNTGGMPLTGGSGGEEPARVRSDFRDTAFWRAAVTTGANGTAVVAVRWPDNLTTWRLTARAVTADTSLGSGVSELTITQPVLVRPVTPRFLVVGDHPRMQAVVHNNTSSTLQLQASLVVSGALALDAKAAPSRRLILSPGTQATVSWDTRVIAGGTGGMRYWVRTVGRVGGAYLEDAVAMQLPVKEFAAPEMVFVSGEVTGTRASESLYLPYSEDPLAGELTVQVVPSLAAATAGGVKYLVEFEHACTEQTTSRYLPLVVLERAYKSQGQKTPYSDQLPEIMQRAFNRLRELQHGDGAWGWWEFDDTRWWQTAYVVHGLIEARNSGYNVPEELLHPGLASLRTFMRDNETHGLDPTSLLNVRAYTLYLLTQAWKPDDTPGKVGLTEHAKQLLGRVPEMSVHARSWLAMSLVRLGLSQESALVLDGVVAAARQDGTLAYWGEAQPDYAGMGTDSRATAIALDALITIRPNDPLIPKVVRWLMSISREGHWDSTQDTSFILIAIAHYLEASKELSANYTWQASAFGTSLGGGVVGPTNLTQTQTLKVPLSKLPKNSRGSLEFTRSSPAGKMYYQMTLRYFAPGEPIEARSKGFSVARSYYTLDGTEPVRDVRAGDVVKVRLTITAPRTSYYVVVTDPLPGGLEGVNGSLKTTSFSERPPNARGTRLQDEGDSFGYRYRYWGAFSNVEMRDDRTLLYATRLSPGTYVYEYFARATTPGVYMSLPASAEQMYQPQVYGHSDGGVFTVK
ncbi:MAG TPA: Ig-like domain-containing protein [Chloroflexia bacterium]|nr:Ig-like domain-containing protein [Chloroflexia bacterium]